MDIEMDIESIKQETRAKLGSEANLDYLTPAFVQAAMQNAKETEAVLKTAGEDIGLKYTVYGNSLWWSGGILYYCSGNDPSSSSDCCGDYNYSARSADSTSFQHTCSNGRDCYAIYK